MFKALKSFSGIKLSMFEGEVRDISDKDIVKDLLNAGYIEQVETAKKETKKKEAKEEI